MADAATWDAFSAKSRTDLKSLDILDPLDGHERAILELVSSSEPRCSERALLHSPTSTRTAKPLAQSTSVAEYDCPTPGLCAIL